MNKKKIIKRTISYVEKELARECGGHDWWHAWRVCQIAKRLSRIEGGDDFIVEMAAWLHDIADRRMNNGSLKTGLNKVGKFLGSLKINPAIIKRIIFAIKHVSYSSVQPKFKTKELKIVQDADRLDGIGAIAIARTFAYGAKMGRLIYDPKIKLKRNLTLSQYKNSTSPSINHFYEKLLLIKNLMNTKTAKKAAVKKHETMKRFLKDFFIEWNYKF